MACPNVDCTNEIGAPRSRLWLACACRNQCADTASPNPARLAANLGRKAHLDDGKDSYGSAVGFSADQRNKVLNNLNSLDPVSALSYTHAYDLVSVGVHHELAEVIRLLGAGRAKVAGVKTSHGCSLEDDPCRYNPGLRCRGRVGVWKLNPGIER